MNNNYLNNLKEFINQIYQDVLNEKFIFNQFHNSLNGLLVFISTIILFELGGIGLILRSISTINNEFSLDFLKENIISPIILIILFLYFGVFSLIYYYIVRSYIIFIGQLRHKINVIVDSNYNIINNYYEWLFKNPKDNFNINSMLPLKRTSKNEKGKLCLQTIGLKGFIDIFLILHSIVIFIILSFLSILFLINCS